MKKIFVLACVGLILLSGVAFAQMTFFLVDNFEDGDATRNPEWWKFDNVTLTVVENPESKKIDFVAESCGKYSLQVKGTAVDWYCGGFGANTSIDASEYTRIQIDIYGNSKLHGKLKIELYEDDNNNNVLEQDSKQGWIATHDDKWTAEIPILGDGFTRISIPFSAFIDDNPGKGDDTWNPEKKDKSGGLLKAQFILIAEEKTGSANFKIDNILLTY